MRINFLRTKKYSTDNDRMSYLNYLEVCEDIIHHSL